MVTCAGPALLNKLNMAQITLIPTSQSIVMANNKSMHIMGAVMVEIRAEKEGRRKYMRQFCYICKEVTGLYLSLSACEDLDGVLPWNKVNLVAASLSLKRGIKRGRLRVTAKYGPSCPSLPVKRPFSEKEVDKLQQWLLDRYAASAFNVCTHQPLHKMSGLKLK